MVLHRRVYQAKDVFGGMIFEGLEEAEDWVQFILGLGGGPDGPVKVQRSTPPYFCTSLILFFPFFSLFFLFFISPPQLPNLSCAVPNPLVQSVSVRGESGGWPASL